MAGESKILTIRLIGNASSAVKAMGETEAAAGGLTGRMAAVSKSMGAVGSKISGVGRSMTHRLTLPIVAVAGASVKMATDFNSAMTEVQTQAGGSAKDVKTLSKQVLDLSGHTLQGPTALAKSMVDLKKVGMDNKTAMDALAQSSKLAAVGNTDVESTTDALAGAWRTGIKGATSFHQEVSVINAAVGSGKMKMEDFVKALGTGILPTAKSAGLGMRDVASSLALFTDENVPAAAAATRLRMSISLLAAPSKAADKVLHGIGLSGAQLGKTMTGPGGLVAAIQLLKDHMKGMDKQETFATLSKAFGGGRSSSAIISMVNNLDVLKKKYKQVDAGAAKFNDDVAAKMKTPSAQFHILLSTLQKLAIQLGNQLLPIVVKMAQGLNKFFTWAGKLPGPLKNLGGVIAIVAAAAGPLLMIIGGLISLFAFLISPIGAVVAILLAAGVGFVELYKHSETFRKAVGKIGAAFAKFGKTMLPILKDLGSKFADEVMPPLKKIGDLIVTKLMPAFAKMLPIITPIAKFLLEMFGGAVLGLINGFIQAIKGVVQIVSGVVALVDDLIHGRWSQAWHDLVEIAKGILNLLVGAFEVWWNSGILSIFHMGIKALAGVFKDGLKLLPKLASSAIKDIGRSFKSLDKVVQAPFKAAFNWCKRFISSTFELIAEDIKRGVSKFGAVLGRLKEAVSVPFKSAWAFTKTVVSKAVDGILAFFGNVPGRVKSVLSKVKGAVSGAFSGAGRWLLSAGKNIALGLIHGLQSMAGAITRTLVGLLPGPLRKFAHHLGIASPSKVFIKFGKFVGQGFVKGIAGTENHVNTAMTRLANIIVGTGHKGLVKLVIHTRTHLMKMADEYQAAIKKVKAAQAVLKKAQDAQASAVADMKANVNDLGTIIQQDTDVPVTFDVIKRQMTNAVDASYNFLQMMKKLKAEGLNATSIKQILAAGVDGGAATAQALLSAGKQGIAQINALQKKVSGNAGALGGFVNAYYQSGVDAANGLIKGLMSKENAIAKAMKRIAKKMVKTIKKHLKIHSPSKVFAEIGGFVGDGFNEGVSARMGDVSGAVSAFVTGMTKAARGNIALPGSQGYLTAPSGNQTVVNVHVAGNVIGEDDFAKRIVPTVRKELTVIGRRNRGAVFGVGAA